MVASGDAVFRQQLLRLLDGHGSVIEAQGGADALEKLELTPCTGLVLDRQLPDLDPDELAGMVAAQYPELEVQMFDSAAAELPGGDGTLDFRAFAAALRQREDEAAGSSTRRAPSHAERRAAALQPAQEAETGTGLLPGIVGRSQHLADISQLVELVAPRKTTVLLLGETGTGKEMLAHGLHAISSRSGKPWVVVNCAAIPEALLESELFGYARGAFTGAVQSHGGRILAAHTGTLFLDEIGELPAALQAKLLRFLQAGELQRLGSVEPQRVDVRVIAATNVDLLQRVESGQFRRDLYYRLAVFPIELQPLRTRTADVAPLAAHFLSHLQSDTPAPRARLTQEALDLLERYPWPGNVRELQHSIERALILAASTSWIEPRHLPAQLDWHVRRGSGPSRAQSWSEELASHAIA
ncbi:MAG: sigma-54 dependent transcriptional regulator [Terriglobales bacterium]